MWLCVSTSGISEKIAEALALCIRGGDQLQAGEEGRAFLHAGVLREKTPLARIIGLKRIVFAIAAKI
ncbi:MAG: hypothetical protein A2Y95_10235 [Deltaproteobacteria bacterium RBG_13_65_10]|nr:MAG: hypothetical protein A2Y95_10235 [Deltaproteobacteria bacterium RBG_13_65_10]